ncbi:MAG: hypothetical protein AB7V36_05890 [Bacteroidales bacterium]|jgi:hypothetical protein
MKKEEIKSLDRVMSFSQVLSSATDISRAESKLFLRALLIYAGPFELARMILELVFRYRQISNHDYFMNEKFIYSSGGLVGIICSVILMALMMVIAYRVVAQYAGQRPQMQKARDLVMVRPGFFYSFAGLLLIQTIIYGIVVFVMVLVVTSYEAPGIIKVLVALGAVFALFYLYTSFSMSPFAMIDEDAGVGKSIDRSFALTKGNKWFIFGLLFVIALMIYLVMLGVGMLAGVTISMAGFSGLYFSNGSFVFLAVVRVLTGVATLFGTGLMMLVLAVQYFNLKERLDASRLEKCVDEIGENL